MTATAAASPGSSQDWKNTLLHRLIEQVKLWKAAENIDVHHVWESGGQYSGTFVSLHDANRKSQTRTQNQIPMSYLIPDLLDIATGYNITIVDFYRALNHQGRYGLIAHRQDLGKFAVSLVS
jgi:hypothetical protein